MRLLKLALLLLLIQGVFAQGFGEIIKRSLPRVSSPLAQQHGIKGLIPGHKIMIGNSFSGPCRIWIYGKEYIADPGEILWDEKFNIPKFSISVPIAALCYETKTSNHPAMLVTKTMWLYGDWEPQSQAWMINQQNFNTFSSSSHSANNKQVRMKKISFPRPYWANDLGIQVLNASSSRIRVFINEIDMGPVDPTDVAFFRLAARGTPLGWGFQIIITIETPTGINQLWDRVSWTGLFQTRQIVFDGSRITLAY